MYSLDMVLPKLPDMGYLNGELKKGRLTIIRQGIMDQDLATADGRLIVLRKQAGQFYGGGIHQYSWLELWKDAKLVCASKGIELIYLYLERYLHAQ